MLYYFVDCSDIGSHILYIFLADQDDIWREDKVQKALAAFEAQDAYVVIHDAQVFEELDSHTGSQEGCQVIMDSFFQFRNSPVLFKPDLISFDHMTER